MNRRWPCRRCLSPIGAHLASRILSLMPEGETAHWEDAPSGSMSSTDMTYDRCVTEKEIAYHNTTRRQHHAATKAWATSLHQEMEFQ